MGYALFHFMVAVGCIAAASGWLNLEQEGFQAEPPKRGRSLHVDGDPLWWREVRRNAGLNLGLFGRLVLLLLELPLLSAHC